MKLKLYAEQWFAMFVITMLSHGIAPIITDMPYAGTIVGFILGVLVSVIIGVHKQRQPPLFRIAKNGVSELYRVEYLVVKGLFPSADVYRKYNHDCGEYRTLQEVEPLIAKYTRQNMTLDAWQGLDKYVKTTI